MKLTKMYVMKWVVKIYFKNKKYSVSKMNIFHAKKGDFVLVFILPYAAF